MVGKNSQVHLFLETELHEKLRKEAEAVGVSIGEIIRRKITNPPTPLEIIELRRLKEFFKKGGNSQSTKR